MDATAATDDDDEGGTSWGEKRLYVHSSRVPLLATGYISASIGLVKDYDLCPLFTAASVVGPIGAER